MQLYCSTRPDSREFFPVPNTEATIQIPYLSAAGTTFSIELHNLSEEIPGNSQLVIGFYNTSSATAGLEMYFSGAAKIVKKQ